MQPNRVSRRLRKLRKRARRALVTHPFMWLAARLMPPLYTGYMRLVWSTSRVEDRGSQMAAKVLRRHNGALALFWHEEVIAWPYCVRRLGFRGHTLVNMSDVGEVITRVAERLDHVVFRGGTSSRRSRRRSQVIRDMIVHMNREDDVFYAVAVDGSQGPPYRLKRGPLVIARECGKPILLTRLWFQRCIRLPTWDRVAIPLPFNRIYACARGPYFVPDGANAGTLERVRLDLESGLIDLALSTYEELRQPRPRGLVKDADAEARLAAKTRPEPAAGELERAGSVARPRV
jgi:lysophospholipid acyltransferase (LPLAT)-like uncharacterized protein